MQLPGLETGTHQRCAHKAHRCGGLPAELAHHEQCARTDFLRHKGQAQQRFKALTIGFKDEHERNLFRTENAAMP
jgi:hypothetical protein